MGGFASKCQDLTELKLENYYNKSDKTFIAEYFHNRKNKINIYIYFIIYIVISIILYNYIINHRPSYIIDKK
jgi:hypothetical protein